MQRRLPTAALLLGVAGLIPFAALAVTALGSRDIVFAGEAVWAMIAYGAVILGFLGGVHWGFALEDPTGAAQRLRLALGVMPALIGWAAMLALLLLAVPSISLAILLAGFVATIATEAQASRRSLIPPGYMWLRWGLSVVVVLILATVLTIRLVGARVIF